MLLAITMPKLPSGVPQDLRGIPRSATAAPNIVRSQIASLSLTPQSLSSSDSRLWRLGVVGVDTDVGARSQIASSGFRLVGDEILWGHIEHARQGDDQVEPGNCFTVDEPV